MNPTEPVGTRPVTARTGQDTAEVQRLNEQFIDACRQGSWELLRPILSDSFGYVDGDTGEPWDLDRYITDLRAHPSPDLTIDQVVIRVVGDVACVTARTSRGAGKHNRYLDVYASEPGGWRCCHASVWPTDKAAASSRPPNTDANV